MITANLHDEDIFEYDEEQLAFVAVIVYDTLITVEKLLPKKKSSVR